jgi:type IV fimbrial biogenesis protein FimT
MSPLRLHVATTGHAGFRNPGLPISQNNRAAAVHLQRCAAGRTQLPLIRTTGNLPAMKKSQPRTARRADASGFTLLELMITVAVLAILMGIAVPSFSEMIRQNRLATQTNDLLTATAVARSEAVKRGSRVTLCPADGNDCSGDENWSRGWLVITDDGPNVGALDAGEMVVQRWPAASEQKLNVQNTDGLTLLSYVGSGAVELADPDTTFTITNERCTNPNGLRTVEVIRAGRSSATRSDCG